MKRAGQQLARITKQRRAATSAFTMPELMVTSAIAALILGSILSTYIFATKGFRTISAYANLHGKQRRAVEVFTRDVRAAYDINTFDASQNTLSLLIPITFGSSGEVLSDKTVTYTSTNSALFRYDSSTAKTALVATNVSYLKFRLFDHDGTDISAWAGQTVWVVTNEDTLATAVVTNAAYAEVKSVKMDLRILGSVVKGRTTEDYSSALVGMRNKDASADEAFDPFDPDI